MIYFFTFTFRFNGLPIMKQSLPQVELTGDCMFGTCPRLVKNKVLRMQKMVPLSFFSFMVGTRQRFQISLGTPMTLGSFALYLKTTLCKYGRWLKTFTMMKRLTLLLQKLKLHKVFWHFKMFTLT